MWSVSLVSEEHTIILDSYRTGTDARTIMTATGVPWARWNTCTLKIVETPGSPRRGPSRGGNEHKQACRSPSADHRQAKNRESPTKRAQRLIAKAGNSASPLPKDQPNRKKACTGKAQAREIERKERKPIIPRRPTMGPPREAPCRPPRWPTPCNGGRLLAVNTDA